MSLRDIPVVTVGPGSQPKEDDGSQLEYIALPKEMSRYTMPDTPEPEEVADLVAAREAMTWLTQALARYQPDGERLLADVSGLDDRSRDLVNQILGEGEVSIRYQGDFRAQIQESVMAGVWRSFYMDNAGRITHDLIEVADVPCLVRLPAAEILTPEKLAATEMSWETMNGPAILTEVAEHAQKWVDGASAHVINLSLLPLSEADLAYLDSALGAGPVSILSRGYGSCEVHSTRLRNVWWVRYYNSMRTLILNSIEITDVPAVACAAPEDIADTRDRLAEILEPYWADAG
jgi:hydrogenase-1 operon protein HyaF